MAWALVGATISGPAQAAAVFSEQQDRDGLFVRLFGPGGLWRPPPPDYPLP